MQSHTLLPTIGESLLNHVSCGSVWQWTQQESMNIPLDGELLIGLNASKNCVLQSENKFIHESKVRKQLKNLSVNKSYT